MMPDPRKVNFTTAKIAKFRDGGTFAKDEYGRNIDDDNIRVIRKRDREWKAFQSSKQQWDAEFGVLDKDELHKYI